MNLFVKNMKLFLNENNLRVSQKSNYKNLFQIKQKLGEMSVQLSTKLNEMEKKQHKNKGLSIAQSLNNRGVNKSPFPAPPAALFFFLLFQ